MDLFYFPLFCVFVVPIQAHFTVKLLNSPGNLDKLDVQIDGSIDFDSSWHNPGERSVQQNMRLDDRHAVTNLENPEHNKSGFNTQQARYKITGAAQGTDKPNKQNFIDKVIETHKDHKSDNSYNEPHKQDFKDKIEADDEVSDPFHLDKSDTSGIDINYMKRKRAKTRGKILREAQPNRHEDEIVGVTHFQKMKTTDYKVKDDGRSKEFSVHLFKQTMQVFQSIKKKMGNEKMKSKVDDMARSYKDQFSDFVRQQRENSIRTDAGDQRAVLHTMETSNLILQRLVNFLKADMEKAKIGRSLDSTLQREVDAVKELEYKHVCTKYGFCRSDRGFTKMLQNCIKVLIAVDDKKMYQARDALTEVLKTGDYSRLIDSKTDKKFKQKINRLEKTEPEDLRNAMRVLLGMLQHSQTPLTNDEGNAVVVRKTAAFYTLLAMWEDVMPADETNKLEWTDIERSLGDWGDGKRTDILEIIKAMERNVRRGFRKVDPETEVKMKEQIKAIGG